MRQAVDFGLIVGLQVPSRIQEHDQNGHEEDGEADLLGVPELIPGSAGKKRSKFDTQNENGLAEIFLFRYGTVVIWGMSEAQEKRFLSSL